MDDNENLGTEESCPKPGNAGVTGDEAEVCCNISNENQLQQDGRPRQDGRLNDETNRTCNNENHQQLHQQLLQDGLDVPGRYRQIAVSLSNCGAYHHYVGRRPKAISLYQQSCRVREDALRLEDKHAAAAVASVSFPTSTSSAEEFNSSSTTTTGAQKMEVDEIETYNNLDRKSDDEADNQQQQRRRLQHQKLVDDLRKTCTAEHRKSLDEWTTSVLDMERTLRVEALKYLQNRQGRRASFDTSSGDSEPRLTLVHQHLDLIETNYGHNYHGEGGRARSSSAVSPSTMRTFLEDEQYGWDLASGSKPLLINPYCPADAPRLDRESLLAMSRATSDTTTGTTTSTVPSITALRRSLDQTRDYLDSCRTLFNMGILHLDNGSDKQAVDILQMALTVLPSQSDPSLRCHILNALAMAKARLGDEEDALSILDDALKLEQNEIGSHGSGRDQSRDQASFLHNNRKRRIGSAISMRLDSASVPLTMTDSNPNTVGGRMPPLAEITLPQHHDPSSQDLSLVQYCTDSSGASIAAFPSRIDASACVTNTLALLTRAHRSTGNWNNAARMATECLRVRAAQRSFECNHPIGAANADVLSEASADFASLAAPKDLIFVTGTTSTRSGEQQHALKLAHPDVACSYYNLGIILAESGRAELAMQYLDAFVDWVGHNFSCQSWHSPFADTLVPSIIFDPDISAQICTALETVARLHLSLTISVTRALQSLKLSLVMRRTHYHPSRGAEIARTLHQLGLVHANIGTTVDSIACFREAAHIFRCLQGADHPDVAAVLCDEGHLHSERGELDEALFCYGEALRIARQNLAALQIGQFRFQYAMFENDAAIGVIELLEVIGNILLDRHDPARAMTAFSEAERMSIFYHFPTTSYRRRNPTIYSSGHNLVDSSNPGAPAA